MKSKKERKPLSSKGKLVILKAIRFFLWVGPVLTVIFLNWEKYQPIQMPQETKWRFPTGLIIALIILAILTINPSEKKIKVNDTIVLFVLFIVSMVLEPILEDLKLLSSVALAGSVINYIFLSPQIAELKETVKMTKQARIQAQAMAEVDRGR